ncbi:DnaJ domain [Macleaya cordata]|uniref:DnaJ domain n=1 Tax=Macleaya cordata TaxID=56857 RepID=A0A200QA98_MACCD|nr:DnaJ domain [Macleaya cordata]
MADHHTTSPADFHNILGLAKGASIRDVCKAYKSLVMRWHPDKNPNSDNNGGARSRGDDPTTPKSFFKHQSCGDNHSGPSTPTRSLSKSSSRRSHTPQPRRPSSLLKSLSRRSTTPTPGRGPDSLSKSVSRRSTTPIMFSCSSVQAKLPPVEKTLECTLEELCHGCVKKIKVTRDVLTENGTIVEEEELLRIKVNPGWKKGTKITFDGMGNDSRRPGTLPADIIFLIDEKRHQLFKREGDDLVLAIEISLLKALTGCTLSIPLLGGEKMSLSFNDIIIYPGYEKIIQGQGMPMAKDYTRRGDLRIKFHIIFPTNLTHQQRSDILNLLKGTTTTTTNSS